MELNDRQLRGRGIKRIRASKPVGIVKPIERTPANRDSNITDITLNPDTSVNDLGYRYEWAFTATEANKARFLINHKREVKVAVLDTGVDYTYTDL